MPPLQRYVVSRRPISEAAIAALEELEETLGGSLPLLTRISLETSKRQRNVIASGPLNQNISAALIAHGWQSEVLIGHGRMRVDFYKLGVLVEIQFGK